jgi:hypothetical protein
MSLAKKYHRTCIVRSYCDLPPKKVNWTDRTLHSTAKIFSSMGINYWRNIAEQSSEDRPLVICLLNAPSNLYFGATHQKHIIENIFLIQTHNMLARKTRSTSPRIFSKSKPQNRAKPNSDIFTAIGSCCDLTISSRDFPISWQMAHAAI